MSNASMPSEEREYLRYLRDLHFRAQGGLCYFCDVEMTPADVPDPKPLTTVTIEHLKGKANGGGSNYLNTAASCWGCNQERSRQRSVGKRTVPRIRIVQKRTFTYAYTVKDDPTTLVLMNTTQGRSETLLNIRKTEGQTFTLLHTTEMADE